MDYSFINIFLEGTVLGFSLALLFGFGPAFFALIQTGIHRGFVPAAFLAFGIFLNDAAIISIMVLGATKALAQFESYMAVGIIGGIVLIILGFFTFQRSTKAKSNTSDIDESQPKNIVFLAKGFLLNLANPFVWIFWLGIVVGITARFSANAENVFIFFLGTLVIVFSTDLLKAFMAAKLKQYITDKFLILVNKIAGIAIMLFGIFLIVRSVIAL